MKKVKTKDENAVGRVPDTAIHLDEELRLDPTLGSVLASVGPSLAQHRVHLVSK
jgi:hypothetical protein